MELTITGQLIKYNNVLAQYKQANLDYINFIQNPCSASTSNQQCYNYIWNQMGCTTPLAPLTLDASYSSTDIFAKLYSLATASPANCSPAPPSASLPASLPVSLAPTPPPLTVVPYSTIVGTPTQTMAQVASPTDCLNAVSTTSGATSASYQQDTQTCNLFSNTDVAITDSSYNYMYSVAPTGVALLHKCNALNAELVALNQTIREMLQTEPQTETIAVQQMEFENTYSSLIKEQMHIKELLKKYDTVKTYKEDTFIFANKEYYIFLCYLLLLVIISCLVVSLITPFDFLSVVKKGVLTFFVVLFITTFVIY